MTCSCSDVATGGAADIDITEGGVDCVSVRSQCCCWWKGEIRKQGSNNSDIAFM